MTLQHLFPFFRHHICHPSRKISLLFLLLWSFSLTVIAQTSVGSLQHQADQLFEKGDYKSALQLYRQAGLENAKNKKLRLRIGISKYEMNDVDGASSMFQSLIREGKTEAPVFFYMAKVYQAKNLFSEAISSYKKFLQRTKSNDPLRSWVKDELTRCANGLRLKYADQDAYVENAGTELNTEYAEFGARYSPTVMDKIYFNSDRNNSTDIYSSTIANGRWSVPVTLPSAINEGPYDELVGFSTDGQILYFLSLDQNRFRIMSDTFSGEEGVFYQGEFKGPFDANVDGADISFFNDSICLFSSNREGGYGGYDLYISVFADGVWTAGMNLGPAINTFYNERFPFLTRNGLTLYYSSDNLSSVGGFDIFKTVFDAKELTWSYPENEGFPVNSNLDDTHFVLSPDGMSAFISSNRKDSHGDFDLYRIFFKKPILAQQQISRHPTFYQTMLLSGVEQPAKVILPPAGEIKEYYISHLFIDESGEVLTPQNTKKLDLLSNLLLIYPRIKAELSSFEIPSGQKTYNLYYSIKKAEQAADYLVRKGVSRDRLILKGYGASFPLAKNTMSEAPSPVYLKLNHRLEFTLHDFETEPVITHIERIPVPDNLLDPLGIKFDSLRHGFYYSVQIASIAQILQNIQLEKVNDMFIEVNNVNGNYRYMAGMMKTFAEAQEKMKALVDMGFYDAYIVPYHNGIRLERSQMQELAVQYPDLLNYLEKVKD